MSILFIFSFGTFLRADTAVDLYDRARTAQIQRHATAIDAARATFENRVGTTLRRGLRRGLRRVARQMGWRGVKTDAEALMHAAGTPTRDLVVELSPANFDEVYHSGYQRWASYAKQATITFRMPRTLCRVTTRSRTLGSNLDGNPPYRHLGFAFTEVEPVRCVPEQP